MFSTMRGLTKEQLAAKEAADPGYLARMTAKRQARAAQFERRKALTKEEPLGTREELLALAREGDKYAIWRADNLFGQSWKKSRSK